MKATSKHTHPVFIWTAENIPRLSGLFIHMGIILPHFSEATDGCLLLSSTAFTKIDNTNCGREGCYLFYDKFKQRWIRSGKVAGKTVNFQSRYKQHLSSARQRTRSSKFYTQYPSKEKQVRYVFVPATAHLKLTMSWAMSVCLSASGQEVQLPQRVFRRSRILCWPGFLQKRQSGCRSHM